VAAVEEATWTGRRRCSTAVTLSGPRCNACSRTTTYRPAGRSAEFVADANTVRRIARLSGVGPGDRWWRSGRLGSLTWPWRDGGLGCSRGATVLVPVLADVLAAKAPGAGDVVEADAMQLMAALLGAGRTGQCGQLPYNVATPLWPTCSTGAGRAAHVGDGPRESARVGGGAGRPGYGAVWVRWLLGGRRWSGSAIIGLRASARVGSSGQPKRRRTSGDGARPCSELFRVVGPVASDGRC